MIFMHLLLGLALTQAAPDAAAPQSAQTEIAAAVSEAPDPGRRGEIAKADAETFLSKCAGRKFETAANSNNAGKLRKARIVLCAKPGETDEQWVATLEKAASSVVASTQLSIEAKAKIAGDLQKEIARLRASQ